ncbi:MAG: proton-conducting transporter membrane subunit, partial [Flavobacterium sp.]
QSDEIEFLIIVFFIFVSSFFLISVNTMVDIILSLEVITLASYVLVAFDKKNRFSAYAAVQYFIIGSIPSVMLILGSAFFYKN